MDETMGLRNINRVFDLIADGKLETAEGKNRPSTNKFDAMALLYMASHTYDFPKDKTVKYPSRLYTDGWRPLAHSLGIVHMPERETMLDETGVLDAEVLSAKIRSAETSARVQVSQSWKRLEKLGLIKKMRRESSYLGRNAAWLLLLGDMEENTAVEREAVLLLPDVH